MKSIIEAILDAHEEHWVRTHKKPQFFMLSESDMKKLKAQAAPYIAAMTDYKGTRLFDMELVPGDRSGVGHSRKIGGTTLEYITWLN